MKLIEKRLHDQILVIKQVQNLYSIINKYNHDQIQAKQKKLQKKKDKKAAPVSDHETEMVDSTAEK